MAKVTSKLQVTIPKVVAEQYGIRPGDDIDWTPAGDTVRVTKSRSQIGSTTTTARRLELFDLATQRQKRRQSRLKRSPAPPRDRGWRREDLYDRDRAG